MDEFIDSYKNEDFLALLEQRKNESVVNQIAKQLANLVPNKAWINVLSKKEFQAIRAIYGKYDPLDIAGTLSDGGRLNIGGAQQQSKYGVLFHKKAGLYCADTVETALKELALPNVPNLIFPNFYKIKFKDQQGNFKIFCFEKVLCHLEKMLENSVNLVEKCSKIPLAGSWGVQKFPMESQIIAQWLRFSEIADGIIFNSTKNKIGKNFFLFLEDSKTAHLLLSAEKINDSNILS